MTIKTYLGIRHGARCKLILWFLGLACRACPQGPLGSVRCVALETDLVMLAGALREVGPVLGPAYDARPLALL